MEQPVVVEKEEHLALLKLDLMRGEEEGTQEQNRRRQVSFPVLSEK